MDNQYKVIDLTFLHEFSGGNNDRMKKYVSMFLEHAPQLLDGINQNYETQNWDSLRIAAHSLKPQAAYMGMKDLEGKLKAIELAASDQTRLDTLPQMIHEVNDTCILAFEELKQVLNT